MLAGNRADSRRRSSIRIAAGSAIHEPSALGSSVARSIRNARTTAPRSTNLGEPQETVWSDDSDAGCLMRFWAKTTLRPHRLSDIAGALMIGSNAAGLF